MDESSEDSDFSDEIPFLGDKAMKPLIKCKMKPEKKTPVSNENSSLFLKTSMNKQESRPSPIEITDIIGHSGCWQMKILILTSITGITTSWNHLGMAFLAYPVDHWCSRTYSTNITIDTWWTEFLPNATLRGQPHHSQCEMYAFNTTAGSAVKSRTVSCDSYEYSSDFHSIVEKWDLVCNEEWMISTSQTVYMIGFLLSVMISGQFADVYGRHPAIMMNIVILIVAGFAAAFSTTFTMFAICRFFVAMGHGGLGLVVYILLVETLGSENRVKYMFLQGMGWHCGYTILPLVAWFEPDWFYLQLIITAPSILFLSFFWILPESPRWLLAKGNIVKAIPILENAAKTNRIVVKDLEAQAKIIASLNCKGKENNSTTTVLDLLRTPNLRMKTLKLYFIWAVIAFTYYGLSLNTNDLQGNQFVNFFLSGFIEIPSTIFCMLTLNRFGRKRPFFLTLLMGGLSCFACIFVPDRFSGVKTGLAMGGKAFTTGSFSIVYLFSSEIFPTVARNVGVGSSSTVARIGSSIAPFMRDLGNATNPSVPLAIFGVLSIISALIVLKMPETNACPIPESIEQAEEFGHNPVAENVNVSYKAESSLPP